ncbi:MAG: 4Fe-4S dicluster domain-containing protein [Candidatus Humimicrobiaceae bacterium]
MTKENKLNEKIIERVGSVFDELSVVVAYSKGNSPLKVSPFIIENKEDIKNINFNKLCINNLATYAYKLSKEVDGKIGMLLKPCDAKAIVQLISEGLIKRDKFKLITVGCSGILDYKKVLKEIGGARIFSFDINLDEISIKTIDKTINLKTRDFYSDKCYWCDISGNPSLYDEFIENDEKLDVEKKDRFEDIKNLEKLSLEEVYSYWQEEMSRCIRCYACRNVCPMEVCQDQCIAHLDFPKWQSAKTNSQENKFFQLIRVMHLAGRCVECGECERVCPQNIGILKMMKKMNQEIERLFDFVPGMNISEKPPLLTYKQVEKNIKEEELI